MLINVCRVCGRSRLCPKAVELFKPGRQAILRRIQLITGIRLQQIPNAPDMVCFCCQIDLQSATIFRRQCILQQKKWVPLQHSDEVGASEEKKVGPNDPSTKKKTTQRRKGRPRMPLEIVDIVVANGNKASADASVGGDEFDQPVEISNEPDATDSDVNLEEIDLPDEDGLESDHDLPNVQIHKCDTCGEIKNNKSSLVRHQFEHNGLRPYPCKECPKTFLSASDLKAHNLTHHTLEPPFACRYCDRRYFSVVGRKKHERVHTNERPFVCDHCGKAFTRTCILKAHMASHQVVRKYSCDVCDRSFSLKKHLATHFISNTHKRNAKAVTSSSEYMSMLSFESDETWFQGTPLTSSVDEDLVQSQFDLLCQEV
ncbi:transcription factor Ouib [Drosophila sechellia]|uniref:GM23757 n=1 Tax=Drosophila sechellia TaxID=7238 RepID=B4HL24_DROSE|nr:transcription factor Ouib [Drosophila sechellia]EDW42988.1 GM23757 [Drosophila sechellia]